MSLSETTKTKDSSLTRDILFAARFYLGNRWALLVLAIIAAVAGLAFNWNWLVAVGLAPILLSTLPCLLMCVFGACMMCRSGKEQSTLSRNVGDQSTPPVSPAAHAAQNAAGAGSHQNPNKAADL